MAPVDRAITTSPASGVTAVERGGPPVGDVAARLGRDGFAELPGWLAPSECDAVDALLADRTWPRVGEGLAAWVRDPRWRSVAAPVLGASLCFVREQVVTKAPHSDGEVPWHQDAGYARIDAPFLTFFVALEDIDTRNGGLWLAVGSHRRGLVDHVPAGYLRTVASPVDEPTVAVPLRRGDAVVFSSLTLHRSGGNATDGIRRAWMVQVAATSAVDRVTGRPLGER